MLRSSMTGRSSYCTAAAASMCKHGSITLRVSALLHAWFPGQYGGQALAEILFGKARIHPVNCPSRLKSAWRIIQPLQPFLSTTLAPWKSNIRKVF